MLNLTDISEEDKLKDLLELEYFQPAPEVWLMLVHPQMIIAALRQLYDFNGKMSKYCWWPYKSSSVAVEKLQQCELGKK